jgi:radical SAM superfamily enzyme YgiQ (UPF0313 family)
MVQDIVDGCNWATQAGLEPHITVMVGYPWETRENALETLRFAGMLMQKGLASTLQSTIVIPYPGTRMYEEALKNDWFRIDPRDYDRFDMREPVLKMKDMSPQEVVEICDSTYKIFFSTRYILRQLGKMRSLRDLRFAFRGFLKILGHVRDFTQRE